MALMHSRTVDGRLTRIEVMVGASVALALVLVIRAFAA